MLKITPEVKEIEPSPRLDASGFSRYRFFPVLEVGYQDYLDLPYNPAIYDLPVANVFTVTVKEENRLDKISYRFYGTTRLFWVLALVNRLEHPFDIPLQTRLNIPSLESLYQVGVI